MFKITMQDYGVISGENSNCGEVTLEIDSDKEYIRITTANDTVRILVDDLTGALEAFGYN